MYFDIAAELKR